MVSSPAAGWPPFIIPDSAGEEHRGILVDIIRKAADLDGREVSFVFYPEKRGQLMLQDGSVDAYPKSKEWVEDPTLFRWTDPVLISEDVLIFRKKDFPISVPNSIEGLHVGVIHGFTYPSLENQFEDGTLRRHDAKCTKHLLHMLYRGHIDVAVTNRQVANWIIRDSSELTQECFVIDPTPIGRAPYGFAFTKAWNNQPFIDHFNSVLANMRKDGSLQQIIGRYQ